MLRTKRKVVVSLHGIRTRGTWQKDLSPLISEQGWIYYPLDYGWFSVLFFVPGYIRKRRIEWFRQRYNEIRSRYPGVIPSIIAHSFGTWILCQATRKYANIRFDQIILAGSVVPGSFDWQLIFARNQVTSVRNDSGRKDIWARLSRFFAWGTGSSGFTGFSQPQAFLTEAAHPDYDHSSAFGYDHYLGEWIPFLREQHPFANGEVPSDSEEPVSPYDAARWSAITYFKQYVCRIAEALTNNEKVTDHSGQVVRVKRHIVVLIPKAPGQAAQGAAKRYFAEKGWTPVLFSTSLQRTAHVTDLGEICDIPSTINSLLCLDHRTDDELIDAVDEFARMLQQRLNDPRSEIKGMVTIRRI